MKTHFDSSIPVVKLKKPTLRPFAASQITVYGYNVKVKDPIVTTLSVLDFLYTVNASKHTLFRRPLICSMRGSVM